MNKRPGYSTGTYGKDKRITKVGSENRPFWSSMTTVSKLEEENKHLRKALQDIEMCMGYWPETEDCRFLQELIEELRKHARKALKK